MRHAGTVLVTFRPMVEDDLAQVGNWLAEPHVQEWWRDEEAPLHVREKYLPRIRGDEPTEMFIVVVDARDVGLVQRYRISHHPAWAATLLRAGVNVAPAAGIDYVIGDRRFLHRGVGSAAIQELSHLVFDVYRDVDHIVVTPQASNRASCRVLEKAGYVLRWVGQLDSDDPGDAGPAAAYVLERRRWTSDRTR